MIQSLYTLLYKIIDYAGMFPPANLELTEAFNNFKSYATGEHSWLLNRFIIPVSQLKYFAELYQQSEPKNTSLSYLLSKIDNKREFFLTLEDELKTLQNFERLFSSFSDTPSYFELNCPREVVTENKQSLRDFVRDTTLAIANTRKAAYNVFYELPVVEFEETVFKYFVEYLATENLNGYPTHLKLRAGGTVSEHFPSSDTLAKILITLKEFNVGFKATAGLHHPFRYFDSKIETKVHGFLNLFCAAILTYIYPLDREALFILLEEANRDDFVFSENNINYKDWNVDTYSIEKARKEFAFSYGSCSFTEPVDDLKKLQML
ncbi:MAG: hypothetical protein ACP5P3_03410 [Ignavibacteria bacterium]